MNKGIKPTRLWHLTGKKHFMGMINGRLSLEPAKQHIRNDHFRLIAILIPSVAGLAYSYGVFGPAKECLGGPQKADGTDKGPVCPAGPCPPKPIGKPPLKCPKCSE